MNNAAQYLEQLKKHHFWVLLGLLVLVGLVVWYLSTAALAAESAQNRTKVEGKFRLVSPYQGGAHPNPKWQARVDTEKKKLDSQVVDAWTLMFEQQGQILRWPKAVVDIVRRKRGEAPAAAPAAAPVDGASAAQAPTADAPPPTTVFDVAAKDLDDELRAFYRNNVITAEWQRLFNLLNLRRVVVEPNAPPDSGRVEGILVWEREDRDALVQRYLTQITPSVVQVQKTQEDLWIFEALFDVIARVNAGSTDPGNAVIKRVEYLDVAKPAMAAASADPGRIDSPAAAQEAASGAALTGGGGGGGGAGFGAGGSSNLSYSAATSEEAEKQILDGRYLDANNQPVPYGAPDPFAEFRQVFVQMRFLMDQRRVPELLAAFANSNLPMEVRQVRMVLDEVDILPADGAVGDVGLNPSRVERSPYDVTVELRGIVYMYTTPDASKLGQGAAPNPAQRAFGIPVIQTE